MNIPEMRKSVKPLMDYLDRKSADPLTIAAYLNTFQDDEQQALFEVALAYIQEVASRDVFFTATMRIYGQIAKDINKAITGG